MQVLAAPTIEVYPTTLKHFPVKKVFSAILHFALAKKTQRAIVLWVVFLSSLAGAPAMAQEPASTIMANAPANRIVLPHSTHPAVQTASDLGRAAGNIPMNKMILVLASDAGQEQALRQLLESLHRIDSPHYHQWLTPEDFRAQFGPSPETVQNVTSWLVGQGFNIERVARSGRWIQFSGVAAQVETAFQTEIHRYQMNAATHLANASDLSLPAEIAPLVSGVLPLHDFSFKQPLLARHFAVRRNAQGNLVPVDPAFTIFNPIESHFLAPGDYAKIYDLASLYQSGANGLGQTIAIVARSKVELTDIEIFRTIFGLPASDPTIIVDGADPGVAFSGDSVEATLDVEWAGAVAPKATIDLVVSASTATTDGVDLSSAYIVDNNLAPIMSVSFGACEKDLGSLESAFFNGLWQQAAAQGISVFVSSGDSGAAGCDFFGPASRGLAVSGLASTPFNTAVGGTEFDENGNDSTFWNANNGSGFTSAIGYIPETVWNESCDPTVSTCLFNQPSISAGGGGASALYTKPGWQDTSIPGVPNDGKRDIPDVSLASALHDGYLLCFLGSCQTTTDSNGNLVLLSADVVGGTSAASPSFAGIMAIVDQQAGGRQGLANYVLYPLAVAENFANCNSSTRTNPGMASSCVFNDVTAGSNGVPGQSGFNAGVGYDLASGLGSVDAANLVAAFVARATTLLGTTTTLAANGSTSVQHGQPVSFTVNVTPASGSAQPTGGISIITSLQGAAGAGSFVTVGAGALSQGAFTGSFANLPGGNYTVSAHYPGDQTFKASDSSSIAVSITKESSTTSLTSPSSFPYGEEFPPLHTVVTGASGQGNASGTMIFSDGTTQLGSVPLNSQGQGDFLPSFPLTFTVGTHTFGASYSGDNSFNPSAAPPVTVTVTKAIPGLAVGTFSNFTGTGTATVFVFNTGPILPTGTVALSEAGKALGGPVPVVSVGGQAPSANFTGLILTAGFHDFTVSYSGDSVYQTTAFNFQIAVFSPFAFDPAPNSSLSQTVSSGQTATYNLLLSAENGFSGTVTLNCTGAAPGTTCSVSPVSANLPSDSSSVPVTVTVTTTVQASNGRSPLKTLPFALAVALAAWPFTRGRRRPRSSFLIFVSVVLALATIAACGGSASSPPPPVNIPPTSEILTITGTSNGATNSVLLQLTVTR